MKSDGKDMKDDHDSMKDEFTYGQTSKITGVQFSYYFICDTKLWLFSHKINLEAEHENVKIGKHIHEDRYKREKRNIQLENINIDFIRKGERIEVHEIKKTRKMEDAHRYQLLYYLYNLRLKGIDSTGIINYPLINKKLDVELTEKDTGKIIEIIRDINRIISGEMPGINFKKICKKCAYVEFCFGDIDEE